MKKTTWIGIAVLISLAFTQYSFNPNIDITLNPNYELTPSDFDIVVSQNQNETDILQFSVVLDEGHWDFTGLQPGMVAGSGTANFSDGLCDESFANEEGGYGPAYVCGPSNDTELQIVVVVDQLAGSEAYFFVSIISSNNPEYPVGVSPAGVILTNLETGCEVDVAYLQPDSGNITQGFVSTMELQGLFINPAAGDLMATSTFVPEVYSDPPEDFSDVDILSIIAPVFGCTDPAALNYEPGANVDNGSCEYGILGDMDQNNSLDVLDIVSVVGIVLGNITPTEYQLWAADINQDGSVNVLDIVELVSIILTP
ncbi:MAG: hypothetical protein GXO91_08010 [FCB group bacterium]|nr:hypothetical protein [FCB group bacterium]